ncbi:MAG: carboxymuconolactone decarboxylase family protein [Chloroflexi bacterium]|nr:carboxymuconolactone decarboxylase family protein [Chloroflexota bacterium]
MPGIAPIRREDLPEFESMFAATEAAMGFVPNSLLTMAHRPEILRAFATLAGEVISGGTVDRGLKQLIALVASTAAGCRYCQAHTASTSIRVGTSPARLDAVYEFESSPFFSEAERAALRLARDAAIIPNATTPQHFADLSAGFSDGEIVEIVAMISLFGWLNRWNETMSTQLEEEPLRFGLVSLAGHAWAPGKHAPNQE